GYFRTIGLRLLRGRDFTAADGPDAPGTVLVSEAAVRRYWPDRDPIGTRIHVGDVVAGPVFTVVGVVADARYQSLDTPEPRPMLYFSALAQPPSSSMLVVRGPRAAALADPVRRAVTSLDPTLPPPTVASLEALVAQATATSRFALTLFAIFGGTALLLVAVGIYGMMAYLVRQRTHELGVRIALGARPTALAASVVWRALALALLGIGLGLVGAWGLTRSLSALLFGVSPTDPPTFAAIALLLALVAVLASLIPARRATRADPLAALRVDG
ncbi:MAG TPA: FtsX-like permease family protein, partial [Gemmatimonadaceae bacterium]|nr:FtsX-like permease family protein [Gemmatimonadaceae bacterium]